MYQQQSICGIFNLGFKDWRDLVVADGFHFRIWDKKLLDWGLWEKWPPLQKNSQGKEIKSCTILTTVANQLVKPIYHPNNHRGKYAKNTEKR